MFWDIHADSIECISTADRQTQVAKPTPGCIELGEGVSIPAAMPGVIRGVAPGVVPIIGVAPIMGVADGATPMGVSSQRDRCFLGVAPRPGVSPPAHPPGVAPPSTYTSKAKSGT